MRVAPNKTRKRFPRIVERELSKNPYGGGNVPWGQCYLETGKIEIDPRLGPQDFLDTLIHELLHREFCFLGEEIVDEVATIIAKEIWKKHYRRIVTV